jgi:hypothetical protein
LLSNFSLTLLPFDTPLPPKNKIKFEYTIKYIKIKQSHYMSIAAEENLEVG